MGFAGGALSRVRIWPVQRRPRPPGGAVVTGPTAVRPRPRPKSREQGSSPAVRGAGPRTWRRGWPCQMHRDLATFPRVADQMEENVSGESLTSGAAVPDARELAHQHPGRGGVPACVRGAGLSTPLLALASAHRRQETRESGARSLQWTPRMACVPTNWRDTCEVLFLDVTSAQSPSRCGSVG